ncbi:hypothetical protein GRI39_06205 [Altererythrobacter indicus]|uniref:Uncharacterized protein n=1 Tax=Altericroceibacterium indicum TaxID=374177 RepID=A0A845A8R1_9SPHN|nr:hypothetical protein [Altericroceibacterium indicum]MXP25633.1 hypothetical protein [Altericroceibacterium indicum]
MNTDYVIIHKNWNGIEIEIRWSRDYLAYEDGRGMAHLEVESISADTLPNTALRRLCGAISRAAR